MDPRTAAIVSNGSMKNAFAEGFVEGRRMSENEVVLAYRVIFWFNEVALRNAIYDSLDEALKVVTEHLRHGTGACVEIMVEDVAEADAPTQLMLPLDFGDDDVSG